MIVEFTRDRAAATHPRCATTTDPRCTRQRILLPVYVCMSIPTKSGTFCCRSRALSSLQTCSACRLFSCFFLCGAQNLARSLRDDHGTDHRQTKRAAGISAISTHPRKNHWELERTSAQKSSDRIIIIESLQIVIDRYTRRYCSRWPKVGTRGHTFVPTPKVRPPSPFLAGCRFGSYASAWYIPQASTSVLFEHG